ncbi:hypothetical protein TWF281_009399 [Arthrobotrys megalospora]
MVNIIDLPTEILENIFEFIAEIPSTKHHADLAATNASANIFNACLTCQRFYDIAGSYLYRFCVINYLKTKETTLYIGSAESVFDFPRGCERKLHPENSLTTMLDSFTPRFPRLTSLAIDRSSTNYALPLEDFFRSLQLLLTKYLTVEKLAVSISYSEHESTVSQELFGSTISCGQNPCFPYPILKELDIRIRHRTNILPERKTIRLWPLELLAMTLNWSSKTVQKLTFSCTASTPRTLLGEWENDVPLHYIFKYTLEPDYAKYATETKRWEMPALENLVLDLDCDTWLALDRYFSLPLDKVDRLGFNARLDNRWCRVMTHINFGKFPKLEVLRLDSWTGGGDMGRILCRLDKHVDLKECKRLKRTEAVIHTEGSSIFDCGKFFEEFEAEYATCGSQNVQECVQGIKNRVHKPSWNISLSGDLVCANGSTGNEG